MTDMESQATPNVAPPNFEPLNIIELVSVKDSKIISVSVYAGRAEITRLFKFNIKTGQNQLNIIGLPSVLDQESIRVEGRGSATIHDVTISPITPPPVPTTSPELVSLLSARKRTNKALERANKSLNSLSTFLGSLDVEHLDVTKLREVVQNYDATAEELDDKVTALEKELKETDEAIDVEKKKLAGPTGNEKLNLKASIGVFAECEGEIGIALIYAVNNANWSAIYDIRVDMQTKDKPITLLYKGSITQSTGEDWDDVPLSLETATPTFGVGVPTLVPWTLSVYRRTKFSARMTSAAVPPPSFSGARLSRGGDLSELSESLDIMPHRGLQVSSKGSISATFGVPGLITIPSDGVGHNVTIVKLSLDAEMSWVSVPKKDSRVHLKAKIKNASEYTLLPGNASVYVDGSFISKSDVPLVSPEENFDCPLGLDPSIRVTYHPRSKKASQSGFYSKTSNFTFTQRITVQNTKSSSSGSASSDFKIKVVDQVPISEDSTITVKLVQPALTLPSADGAGNTGTVGSSSRTEVKAPPPIKISSGVVAMWDGAEDIGQPGGLDDLDALGREGRFCWVCTVPPQGKVAVVLQWDVAAPAKTEIAGM